MSYIIVYITLNQRFHPNLSGRRSQQALQKQSYRRNANLKILKTSAHDFGGKTTRMRGRCRAAGAQNVRETFWRELLKQGGWIYITLNQRFHPNLSGRRSQQALQKQSYRRNANLKILKTSAHDFGGKTTRMRGRCRAAGAQNVRETFWRELLKQGGWIC